MQQKVAIVVKGYPRLSETFIAQEMLGLQNRGIDGCIVSLRKPTDKARHSAHDQIQWPVFYLPEYLIDEPFRVFLGLLAAGLFPRRLSLLLRLWFADFWRDPTLNRIRRLGQALVLARELKGQLRWIYVHYLHTPASVGRYAAKLLDVPFSLSAHAKDIWTSPSWEKAEKIEDAQWTVTCTRSNLEHLKAISKAGDIRLVYHGLDLTEFPEFEPRLPRQTSDSINIVSVARAVEKKGLDVLLKALAELPSSLDWSFRHIGDGPLLDHLKLQTIELGIEARVSFLKALPRARVIKELRRADLFVMSARIAQDGDRDGLPNVLMEALSQQLCVVASRLPGIEEIIADGETGRLVGPEDPLQLAQAIDHLAQDPSLCLRLGEAGRHVVQTKFDSEPGIDRIAMMLSSE